jgi:hypothetical protein
MEIGRLGEMARSNSCETRVIERHFNALVAANSDAKEETELATLLQLQFSNSFVLRLWQMETALLGNGWQREPRPKRVFNESTKTALRYLQVRYTCKSNWLRNEYICR